MPQSNEVVDAVVRTFYNAINQSDPGAVAGLVADDQGAVFVGTDGDEWWAGPAEITGALQAQIEETGGHVKIVEKDPVAYASGDVAWFADRPSFRLPDGSEIPTRLTGVAVRTGSDWRIVQGHISIGGAGN